MKNLYRVSIYGYMVFNIGTLVLCQFFWANAQIAINQPQDQKTTPKQLVGTVKAVYSAREIRDAQLSDKGVAIATDTNEKKYILKVVSDRPKTITYFFNSTACIPVKNREEAEAELTAAKVKNEEQNVPVDSEKRLLPNEEPKKESLMKSVTKALIPTAKKGTGVEQEPVAPKLQSSEKKGSFGGNLLDMGKDILNNKK